MKIVLFAIVLIQIFSCEKNTSRDDVKEITAHIHSIYQAFVDTSYTQIKNTHLDDWIGFKNSSQKIVRNGIDGYMETIGFDSPMLDYKIIEIEVKLYGDMAAAYYVASYRNNLKKYKLIMTSHVRAVDIYKKINGEWIQAGSNINIIPKKNALEKDLSDEYFNVSFENIDE